MLWLNCNLFTVRAKRTRLNRCQVDYVWLSCVVFIVWLSAYCHSLLCPNVTSEDWHVKVLLRVQKCPLQREEFVVFFPSGFFCRYKLIRRRVIWLIGQWISVKFKSDLRPVLYEIILSLMQDPDLVVRHLQIHFLFLSLFSWNHSSSL